MTLSLWLAAPMIGLLLSLFAAGGGMIAVPLLSYGLGMPFKQAIATSLIIVASVSFISLLQKKRWKLINWRLHRFSPLAASLGVSQAQMSACTFPTGLRQSFLH